MYSLPAHRFTPYRRALHHAAAAKHPQRPHRTSREVLEDALADLVADVHGERSHLPIEIIERAVYEVAATLIRKRSTNRIESLFTRRPLCTLAAEAGVVLTDAAIEAEVQRMRENLAEQDCTEQEREDTIASMIGLRVDLPPETIEP